MIDESQLEDLASEALRLLWGAGLRTSRDGDAVNATKDASAADGLFAIARSIYYLADKIVEVTTTSKIGDALDTIAGRRR